MAAGTKIGWCSYRLRDGRWVHGHTFNGWWGCAKWSRGCKLCYAEKWSARFRRAIWGRDTAKRPVDRVRTKQPWTDVHRWNKAAEAAGTPALVFASSMSDVFEDHRQLPPWRAALWKTIAATPWLVWMLLTKRPENIAAMVPPAWLKPGGWPANVWPGASLEQQRFAADRILPLLALHGTPVRFLSVEPLVGPVDLTALGLGDVTLDALTGLYTDDQGHVSGGVDPVRIDWVIGGGESHPSDAARMDPAWLTALALQCAERNVPFFAKQTGTVLATEWALTSSKGDNPAEWPAHVAGLWVQQHPSIRTPVGGVQVGGITTTIPEGPR